MTREYKDFFKGKKVLIMGLGLLGRGVGVARFLTRAGGKLTITDLKTEKELALSLRRLRGIPGPDGKKKIPTYILGRHRFSDFQRADMVIKAAGVPIDSPYLVQAREKSVPVEMDASLFAKLLPPTVTLVGITGTRGKSTVTHLIYEILRAAGRRSWLGGNIKNLATLPLLAKVRSGDTVVLELDSWQLQGFGDSGLSPNIAVFTNFLDDHLNYYRGNREHYFTDKANIFRFQKPGDYLILGQQFKEDRFKGKFNGLKSKIIFSGKNIIPKSWRINLLGKHNQDNAACALAAVRALRVPDSVSKKVMASFSGVPGRLELIAKINGIEFWNDTTATIPEATIAALKVFGRKKRKRIILLGGGADKELTYGEYAKVMPRYVKTLILFAGRATDKIIDVLKRKYPKPIVVSSMKDALKQALIGAVKGDIVLLSPAAASFGVFRNEYDRGSQFIRQVKKLKQKGRRIVRP
jgi:UDP-N-acetylmuramoylalanine--D-glutamate ligase